VVIFRDEADLLATIDEYDRLIAACADGTISFQLFLDQYNSFPMWAALDGHESDEDERRLLSKHAARCAVHWRVWNEVLVALCSDNDAGDPRYVSASRFGSAEGLRRLQQIAHESLDMAPR
jgi:hypothetical protein